MSRKTLQESIDLLKKEAREKLIDLYRKRTDLDIEIGDIELELRMSDRD